MDPEEARSKPEEKHQRADGLDKGAPAREEEPLEASELADRAMEKRDDAEGGTPQSLF